MPFRLADDWAARGGGWPEHVRLSDRLQMFHAQFLASVEAKVRLLQAVGECVGRRVAPEHILA